MFSHGGVAAVITLRLARRHGGEEGHAHRRGGPLVSPLLSSHASATCINQVAGEEAEPSASAEAINTAVRQNAEANAEEERKRAARGYGTLQLLRIASPHRWWLYSGCVVLLVRLPLSLSIPHWVAETIGCLVHGDFGGALRNIAFLCACGTGDAVLDFWVFYLFNVAQQRIIRGLRLRLLGSILDQEIGFFDTTPSGEIASRLTADCAEMANDLTWVFRFTIEALGRIGGILVYMFFRSWRAALLALAIIPLTAVINRFYARFMHANQQAVQTALADANAVSQEAIGAIRTVRACAMEPGEKRRYTHLIDVYYALMVKQIVIKSTYFMVCNTFLINTVVQAALLGYGTYLVRDGLLQPTVLLAFMLYQGQLQEYFQNLFNSFTSLLKSSGAAAKVFEYVERRPRCRNASAEADSAAGYDGQGGEETTPPSFVKHTSTLQPGGAAQGSRGGGHVAIRDVHFCYPSRPEIEVLCGFSLEVPAGKSFALVGPSGNGKSTVFALLKRFYEPQSGVVTLDGVEVSRIRSAALHRQIALVSQEPVLMSGTIESNITYSLQQEGDPLTEGSVPGMTAESVAELRRKVVAAATAANAHCFVSGLKDGYGTQVGERGVQLSGGQRQRIAIARSLLQDPLVLLLDEATSALDSESESMVQEALERAMVGRTTLVIAHRLSTVRNADQLAFMNGGRVVEMGTHDELMAKPLPPEGEDEEGRRRSGPTYRQHVRLQTAAAALPTNGS